MAVAYTDTPVKKTKGKAETKRKQSQEQNNDKRGKTDIRKNDDTHSAGD